MSTHHKVCSKKGHEYSSLSFTTKIYSKGRGVNAASEGLSKVMDLIKTAEELLVALTVAPELIE